MKVLNLYCGIGGNRKLWRDVNVTAIEIDKEIAKEYKKKFPKDEVIVGDAHKYLLENFEHFDFIWSSPPCPTHSDIRRCGVHAGNYKALYPQMDLYQQIILLKHFAKPNTKWIIENVIPYYDYLIQPNYKLHRHSYWSNFKISNFEVKTKRVHNDLKGSGSLYGFNISNSKIKNKRKVLRNMVDPDLGLHIFNCFLFSIKPTPLQMGLFKQTL
tara:strand:+ start:56 stop:694 length:639 start_codon:yes stop_codon:yes gene_type:complete